VIGLEGPTSVLLRSLADELVRASIDGTRVIGTPVIAHELRARAELLEQARSVPPTTVTRCWTATCRTAGPCAYARSERFATEAVHQFAPLQLTILRR